MRRIIAVGIALTLPFVQSAAGGEHLVSPAQVDERLMAARQSRAADLERVDAVLARPEVGRAAASAGLDIDIVRRAVPRIDDAELHDLAVRAEALRADPVAGSPIVVYPPVWLIVACFVVVLAALAGVVWAIVAISN
jgi:hypothetical protein